MNLSGAHLEEAILIGAQLEGADLRGAHLENAHLGAGRWEWTDLAGAHREEWSRAANLKRADLRGAHLENAHLAGGVNLQGAVADERTGWPDAFDWHTAGVIVTGEDASSA